MEYTRSQILQSLVENIPSDHLFMSIPFMIIPVDGTDGGVTESTRLIEDLDMDSIDIESMVYDAASQLGMNVYDIDSAQIGNLDTVGDCVNLLQKHGG